MLSRYIQCWSSDTERSFGQGSAGYVCLPPQPHDTIQAGLSCLPAQVTHFPWASCTGSMLLRCSLGVMAWHSLPALTYFLCHRMLPQAKGGHSQQSRKPTRVPNSQPKSREEHRHHRLHLLVHPATHPGAHAHKHTILSTSITLSQRFSCSHTLALSFSPAVCVVSKSDALVTFQAPLQWSAAQTCHHFHQELYDLSCFKGNATYSDK